MASFLILGILLVFVGAALIRFGGGPWVLYAGLVILGFFALGGVGGGGLSSQSPRYHNSDKRPPISTADVVLVLFLLLGVVLVVAGLVLYSHGIGPWMLYAGVALLVLIALSGVRDGGGINASRRR